MQTRTAQDLATAYSKHALGQIADHAKLAADLLRSKVIEMRQDGKTFKECRPYMEDSDDYKQLYYYLQKVMKHSH